MKKEQKEEIAAELETLEGSPAAISGILPLVKVLAAEVVSLSDRLDKLEKPVKGK